MPLIQLITSPLSPPTLAQLILLIAITLCSTKPAAQTAEQTLTQATLQVTPERCISLHQGQVCYQKLTFSWQTPDGSEYCLYENSATTPLVCWMGNSQTQYVYEFESAQSSQYILRQKNQQQELASVKVQVASVYRSSQKSTSNWRLF